MTFDWRAKSASMSRTEWLAAGRAHSKHKRFTRECVFCSSERELNKMLAEEFHL